MRRDGICFLRGLLWIVSFIFILYRTDQHKHPESVDGVPPACGARLPGSAGVPPAPGGSVAQKCETHPEGNCVLTFTLLNGIYWSLDPSLILENDRNSVKRERSNMNWMEFVLAIVLGSCVTSVLIWAQQRAY